MKSPILALALLLLPAALLQGAASSKRPAEKARDPNPTLAKLPENSWRKISPFAPVDKGILAYSGGTFDSINGQFLIFGGGHADYWGNEVWAFSTKTLTWKKMYEPDARERYTNDNIDNARGKLKDSDKPYTRHSYNQICFVPSPASMFIFGGCGPGWGEIRPTCPCPPDCWAYSFEQNKWTQLYFGKGTPSGFAFACCYDGKRNMIWIYSGDGRLHGFDLAANSWSARPIKADLAYMGTYNFQMAYLPKSDRLLVIGSDACEIDPDQLTASRRHLDKCGGKAGLTYLVDQDAALYVSLPGEGLEYRMAVFNCANSSWHEWNAQNKLPSAGCLWSRLQYDAVDQVALLVGYDGVWAFKPPQFRFKQADALRQLTARDSRCRFTMWA